MRCYCCNNVLSYRESTRKFKESGSFVDMCDACLETLDNVEVTAGYQGPEDGEETEEESNESY